MSMLARWPETEKEYWAVIEYLGGYIWRTRHDHMHGRCELPENLMEVQQELEKVADEAVEKFNLVPMKECTTRAEEPSHAPDGREYYWPWYSRMKLETFRDDYEATLCSACPFSRGLNDFASSHTVPCSEFRGWTRELDKPWLCAMTSNRFGKPQWTEAQLELEVRAADDGDWEAFCTKRSALQDAAAEDTDAAATACIDAPT